MKSAAHWLPLMFIRFKVVSPLLVINIVNAFEVCYNWNIKMTAQIMTEIKATINADNSAGIKEMYPMKVLIINGSPRINGNTAVALNELVRTFEAEGIETEVCQIGGKDIRGCIACGKCSELRRCVFNDEVNEIAVKFEQADGLILASPVYYASANATLIACLDRLFYSSHFDKTMKVGASIVIARRGGCSSTFDELNKYFTICGMPVASSTYWNSVHGRLQGEAEFDTEGLCTMRNLAHNMSFLMKSIALGKEKYGMPEREYGDPTHFVRDDLK